MKVKSYIEKLQELSLEDANLKIYKDCGIPDFLETKEDIKDFTDSESIDNVRKDEYGDWQTNYPLALSICNFLKAQGVNPEIIIEPTCGKGNFVLAALQTFDSIKMIYGVELYKPYIKELKYKILDYSLQNPNRRTECRLFHLNVFDFDFKEIAQIHNNQKILIIGNPPWVTNKELSEIDSENLPQKSNFKKVKGLEAITGKGNFDISEFICYQIIEAFGQNDARFSFLVKNSVVKNIIYEQKDLRLPIQQARQYNIDAQHEFNVSVSACLMDISFGDNSCRTCEVLDFYSSKKEKNFGWLDNKFVSNIEKYKERAFVDGTSPMDWWSGIKHDCAKVMELTQKDGCYVNGFGEIVDIEEEALYPLMKSSDIKNLTTRKFVIITQHSVNEDTKVFLNKYPKAAAYLLKHAEKLDKRGSVIYKKRPRFSMFGVGDYSFSKYKVAVSGLYKQTEFSLLQPTNDKPILVDDTCYLIGFSNEEDARITQKILNSYLIQELIQTLMFSDAKRVINKELLMRLDILEAAKYLLANDPTYINEDLSGFINRWSKSNKNIQQTFLFC